MRYPATTPELLRYAQKNLKRRTIVPYRRNSLIHGPCLTTSGAAIAEVLAVAARDAGEGAVYLLREARLLRAC